MQLAPKRLIRCSEAHLSGIRTGYAPVVDESNKPLMFLILVVLFDIITLKMKTYVSFASLHRSVGCAIFLLLSVSI